MGQDIFRHDSIERLSSPSQLSKLLVIVRLRGWIVLASLVLIIMGILVWSFIGQIPIITTGQGILLSPETQFPMKSPADTVVSQIFVELGHDVPKGAPLVRFTNGMVVEAPQDGNVFQLDMEQGEAVKVGQTLLWFQTPVFPNQLEVYGFIPIKVGERIQEGMPVAVELNAIDTRRYGQLVGVVKQIIPYAVSADSDRLRTIPSKRVREDLTKGESMELIIIQPILDPKNPSGLKWSFGQGPDYRLGPGSMGKVRVTIENKRPISYLIPALS